MPRTPPGRRHDPLRHVRQSPTPWRSCWSPGHDPHRPDASHNQAGTFRAFECAEGSAGAEVYRNFPRAPAAECRVTLPPDRLRTALAAWGIQTRRALARQPAMATLAEITRVQTTILAATRVVLDAAAGSPAIDPVTHQASLNHT